MTVWAGFIDDMRLGSVKFLPHVCPAFRAVDGPDPVEFLADLGITLVEDVIGPSRCPLSVAPARRSGTTALCNSCSDRPGCGHMTPDPSCCGIWDIPICALRQNLCSNGVMRPVLIEKAGLPVLPMGYFMANMEAGSKCSVCRRAGMPAGGHRRPVAVG